jgi:hypothetical protein
MSIVDVARIAEVSTATVSRVLNAPGSVRAETADRVHAAMQRLGYSLPTVRRGPKIGPRAPGARPNQIAVIAIGTSLRWFERPAMGGIRGDHRRPPGEDAVCWRNLILPVRHLSLLKSHALPAVPLAHPLPTAAASKPWNDALISCLWSGSPLPAAGFNGEWRTGLGR